MFLSPDAKDFGQGYLALHIPDSRISLCEVSTDWWRPRFSWYRTTSHPVAPCCKSSRFCHPWQSGESSPNRKCCHHIGGRKACVDVRNVLGNLDRSDRWDRIYDNGQNIGFHHPGSDSGIQLWNTSFRLEGISAIHLTRSSLGLYDQARPLFHRVAETRWHFCCCVVQTT